MVTIKSLIQEGVELTKAQEREQKRRLKKRIVNRSHKYDVSRIGMRGDGTLGPAKGYEKGVYYEKGVGFRYKS
jgi:hypothetical protein